MLATIITSKLFWAFVVLNFVNVLVNTARSLLTIKGGKWIASVMNAVCYGYYTIIIVITATYEMPLFVKCIAVAVVNFIGVFTIKYCEEKIRKDKKWIIIATAKVSNNAIKDVATKLEDLGIKLLYSTVIENRLYSLQIFSHNSKETTMIKAILDNYDIRYSAVEEQKM